jgi:hypothetical protein
LSKPAAEDGYIVQQIIRVFDYKTKDGHEIEEQLPVYWEAWFVKNGETWNTAQTQFGFTDSSHNKPIGVSGTFTVSGESKFFYKTVTGDLGDPGANPVRPPDPATGWSLKTPGTTEGFLPTTRKEPEWWKKPSDQGEATGTRSVTAAWSPNGSTIVVTPQPPVAESGVKPDYLPWIFRLGTPLPLAPF